MSGVFCATCLASSTDETPGDISISNAAGLRFYGGSQRCGSCGSQVKSLWWVLLDLPLIPLGCYRHLEISDPGVSRFAARKTSMDWPQVLRIWIIGIVLLPVVAVIALVVIRSC